MILIAQSNSLYEPDIRAMVMAFFPGEKIQVISPFEVAQFDREAINALTFLLSILFDEDKTRMRVEEGGHVIFSAYTFGDYTDRKAYRNKFKLALYKLLSEYTGRVLPWGSLTGMRPTKIATKAMEEAFQDNDIIDYYKRTYETSEAKARLALDVAKRERRIINMIDPAEDYCLYIGIPFCPTRCIYCSFTAYPVREYASRVDDYVEALRKELANISLINKGRRLIAVYMGGGTPTALSAEQLDKLMTELEYSFDLDNLLEFTVEAGRPDSITREKLEVMKAHGVTRISINPQSMNQKTLKAIGRAHTPEMIVDSFKLARELGFDNINMDLIAGLPGEKLGDMAATLDEVLDMGPESITVHSLAIKKKAGLNERYDEFKQSINQDIDRMLLLSAERARGAGMLPYYLYRQRNIAGNLENTGFALPGAECRYNVLIMEERLDTFAAGAGSVTRLVSLDEDKNVIKVDRVEDVKNVDEYIQRIEEMIERKKEAYSQSIKKLS